MADGEWFVVYTKPNAESYARDFLMSRHFKCLVYLPMVRLVAVRRGRKYEASVPFISRYMFVMNDGRGSSHLRSAPGVASLMRCGEDAVQVADEVLDRIRRREDATGHVELDRLPAPFRRSFRKNDAIKITDNYGGVWDGLFQRMSGDMRASVFLRTLGGLVKATVPVGQIEAI